MNDAAIRIDPEQILSTYADMVYRLCRVYSATPEYAEDAFQEVFLKLIPCRKVFESEEHLKAWLIRVTINQCRTLYASSHRDRLQPLENSPEPASEESREAGEEDPAFDRTDRRLALEEALKTLSREDRLLIQLFYYEEMSVEEICSCLSGNSTLIRVRLHRIRKKLRVYFEEKGLGYEDL